MLLIMLSCVANGAASTEPPLMIAAAVFAARLAPGLPLVVASVQLNEQLTR